MHTTLLQQYQSSMHRSITTSQQQYYVAIITSMHTRASMRTQYSYCSICTTRVEQVCVLLSFFTKYELVVISIIATYQLVVVCIQAITNTPRVRSARTMHSMHNIIYQLARSTYIMHTVCILHESVQYTYILLDYSQQYALYSLCIHCTHVCSIHNIVRSYIIYILASIFSSIMNNKNTIVRGVFIQYGYQLEQCMHH